MRLTKVNAGSFAYSRLAQSMSRFGRGDRVFNEDVPAGDFPNTNMQKSSSQETRSSLFNNNNSRSTLIIEKIVDRRNDK
jgi:hypothetical protein